MPSINISSEVGIHNSKIHAEDSKILKEDTNKMRYHFKCIIAIFSCSIEFNDYALKDNRKWLGE